MIVSITVLIAEAIEKLEEKFDVSFTLMVSAEESSATELVKKYIA